MKCRNLIMILSIGLISLSFPNQKVSDSHSLFLDSKKETNKIKENDVFNYMDVLECYYHLGIGDSENPSINFDDFYDSYYADDSDRNLYDFTLNLAYDNGNYDSVYETLYGATSQRVSTCSVGGGSGGGSSSQDADYILKDSYDYSNAPMSSFGRQPYYSVYDYSLLKKGDIVWETETILFNSGHSALITNTTQNSSYGNYIQTVEAVGGGVQRGFLDDLRMTAYKCEILRVSNSNASKIDSTLYFAKKQIGKPYSLNIYRLNTSINSTEWYCSELVYASWKYAGIDIGVKKDANGNDVYLSLGCLPKDINDSYNTYRISMPYYGFLSLSINSKSSNTWKIKVRNASSVEIKMFYNSKMCFKGDAESWANLNDVKSINISSYSYVIVDITENWFATSITTSYVKGKYRIITYADNLNTNGTLSTYQSVVEK